MVQGCAGAAGPLVVPNDNFQPQRDITADCRLVCTNSPAADLGNGNPAWPLTPTLRSAKALGSLKGPKAFCPRGWFLVKTTKFMDRKGILAGHPCFHSLGLCFKGEVPSSRVEFQATPSKQGL